MMDRIEAFMNKLTDIDWGWWPVLFLRPAKDKDIDNVILLKLSLVFGSALAVFWLLMIFLRRGFITSGTFVLAFILGWLFFFVGSKVSYAYFWNRRARRLRKQRREQSVAQNSRLSSF
jgi:hypothetical protein